MYWPPMYFLAYQFVKGGMVLPVMNVMAYIFAVMLSYLNNNRIQIKHI